MVGCSQVGVGASGDGVGIPKPAHVDAMGEVIEADVKAGPFRATGSGPGVSGRPGWRPGLHGHTLREVTFIGRFGRHRMLEVTRRDDRRCMLPELVGTGVVRSSSISSPAPGEQPRPQLTRLRQRSAGSA